jgi:hypothetical protein
MFVVATRRASAERYTDKDLIRHALSDLRDEPTQGPLV